MFEPVLVFRFVEAAVSSCKETIYALHLIQPTLERGILLIYVFIY